jgi:hypothetical protein
MLPFHSTLGECLQEHFRSKLGIWSLCRFKQNAQIGGIFSIDLGGPSIGFLAIAPFAMERIRMYPASLPMSRVSTMIMGPVGHFMYESSGYISRTSPILLAMIMKVFLFLNCS